MNLEEAPTLLALCGMSPAILTETIWSLAHQPDPVIPARVIVVTTLTGRRLLAERLFQPNESFGEISPWESLRLALLEKGFNLENRLRFGDTSDDVRVITTCDSRGRSCELDDIRTAADNQAAADHLLEQLRGLVENPDVPLIASIAGGRKTLGALLYAAMTLIGRETDILTHVLVSEPFENLPNFFFPGQPGGSLLDRSGKEHDPANARIDLATVPFVPLRNVFTRELGQPAGTFSRLVASCHTNIRRVAGEHLQLELPIHRPACRINGRTIKLSPREYLVLLYFAQRIENGEPILSGYDEAVDDLDDFRVRIRKTAPAKDWSDWRQDPSLGRGVDVRELTRLLSDLRTKAKKAGGDAVHLATCLPVGGRCGLDIPAENLDIIR